VTIAAGPFAIAALLLGVAGAMKALSPNDTATALRRARVPAPPWVVRVGGAVEAAIGGYALAAGDRLGAGLVAASYLAFTAFVVYALVRDLPISSCGCFGKADTPPSRLHVVFNLLAVAASLVVVADPPVAIDRVVRAQPLSGVPFVLLVTIGAYLSFLVLTAVPRTLAAGRAVR
jgi:hypothetical protein